MRFVKLNEYASGVCTVALPIHPPFPNISQPARFCHNIGKVMGGGMGQIRVLEDLNILNISFEYFFHPWTVFPINLKCYRLVTSTQCLQNAVLWFL